MDMEDYLLRFLEIEDQLSEHDQVALLNGYMNDVGYGAQIDTEIEKLPFSLPKTIRDFYYHIDTLQLRWLHKRSSEYQGEKHDQRAYYFDPFNIWYEDFVVTACINILSFEQVFLYDWMNEKFKVQYEFQKKIRFKNKEFTGEEFYSRLYPFDLFHPEHAAAFYFDKENDKWLVLTAIDQFADFHHSVVTDFESYLEMILHQRGLVSSRIHFYGLGAEERQIRTPKSFWVEKEAPNLENYSEED
ncbi:MAG: hypothetical protein AAF985_22675 [Bacteroidota bacterium]